MPQAAYGIAFTRCTAAATACPLLSASKGININKIKYLRYFFTMRLGAMMWAMVSACSVHAADTLTIAATGTAMPMLKILVDDFSKSSPGFKATLLYPPGGSGGAIPGVATTKVGLCVTARVPKPDAPGSDLRAMSVEMSRAVNAALLRPGLPRADHDLNNLDILDKVSGTIGSSTLAHWDSTGGGRYE